MLSTDIYAYVISGRIFAVYKSDPYSETPVLPASDPYLPLWDMGYLPSWYGPLWTLLSGGIALLSGERIGLTVLLFRGAAIVAALAAAALLWGCLRRAAPHRAAQGLVFFLWNPLVVLETGLSGHNDTVMLALLLLGIWLHLRGRRALAVTAMTFSALVKYVTGLVLPLYVLVVLRHLSTWRERGRFLAMSAASAALAALIVFGLARAGPEAPVARAGFEVGFYYNSVHELLFRALRVWLGEEPEYVRVPINFGGWWVATHMATELRSAPGPAAELLDRVEPGTTLLVIAPQEDQWPWVYNPATGRKGYVHEQALVETDRPAAADTDPVLAQLEAGPMSSPTALQANAWLRLLTWIAFGAFWLLAAWRATHLRGFVVWSAAVMLATYWLVITEAWPWYPIWALALAALAPTSRVAGLAALLSATVLSLYITGGYQGSDQEWIYTYRSLPAFVLPLALFLLAHPVRSLLRCVKYERLR
jgi:hypothetical protein